MEVFFNELSLKGANSSSEVDIWIKTLVDNVVELTKIDNSLVMRYSKPYLKEVFLYRNYTIIQSLNNIEKEKKTLFLKKISSNPLIYPDPDYPFYDYEYQSIKAIGLGYAYINNSYSISLISELIWKQNIIEFIELYLNEKDPKEIISNNIKVKNIALLEHTIDYLENIKKNNINKRKELILSKNGSEIWDEKEIFFPNLIFCDNVKQSLYNLKPQHPEFVQIINILFGINICFDNKSLSHEEYYNCLKGLPSILTTESMTRKNKIDFRFKCPDNLYRYFYDHFRYTPGAGRIHIHSDYEVKKCYIGYIGPHL